jgi:hypothetical protein
MYFIRLPKLRHDAERELLEMVPDRINMKTVQNINMSFIQKF